MNKILDRALKAEEERDVALARIEDLEARMHAMLNSDPTSASQALSWVGRAENSEKLLREIERAVKESRCSPRDLPAGWYARVEAQLRTVAILARDQAKMAERPADDDLTWETYFSGETRVIRRAS